MIRKEGDKYVLYTKDGSRKLGEHGTRAGAEAQERAVEANKNREAFADTIRSEMGHR